MCPEVHVARHQRYSRQDEYLPQVRVEQVVINGNIVTNRSIYNHANPFHSDIEIYVRDRVEAKKLEHFIGGQVVQIRADRRGTFNGKPDLVSPTDGRFVNTLTAVIVDEQV